MKNSAIITLRLSIILIAVMGIISYTNTNSLLKSHILVDHTHQVIETLEYTRNLIIDSETGVRGYIISGDIEFNDPYNKAVLQINPSLDYISNLTSGSDNQQRRLFNLRVLINRKMAYLEKMVNLRKVNGFDTAKANLSEDKQLMHEIRVAISDMKREEEDLLVRRTSALHYIANQSLIVIPVLIILDVIIQTFCMRFLMAENGCSKNF